jgi:hypothetical protein
VGADFFQDFWQVFSGNPHYQAAIHWIACLNWNLPLAICRSLVARRDTSCNFAMVIVESMYLAFRAYGIEFASSWIL